MDGGDSAGGSAELARLINEHGECLLSDFYRYYHLDITDVLVPGSGLTPRKAVAMIRSLPLESATIAAIRGGVEFRGWGTDRYLTAALVDAVRENTYAFVSANSKRRVKAPTPVSRPDNDTRQENNFAAMARRAHFAGRKQVNHGGGTRGS